MLKFSWKISLVGSILIACFLSLAYWQWTRHLEKSIYIQELEDRIKLAPSLLVDQIEQVSANPEQFVNRRFIISGSYDFEQEIYIRNRSHANQPGVLVVTPLKIQDLETGILISRGFIPLADAKSGRREKYQNEKNVTITGLLKPTSTKRWLAPSDPPTAVNLPRVTDFLRINIKHIARQIPYPLAPFYLELFPEIATDEISNQIVKNDSDKAEMLILPLKSLNKEKTTIRSSSTSEGLNPTPMFSTVVPTIRHLGYVFEWSAMACMTLLICLVLQFKRGGTH